MTVTPRKHPVIALGALLIAGLLAWGFWPQPAIVELAAVTRGPLTVTIEEEGRTRVVDRYVIAAPVNGVTCRVELDVGDAVESGQVLLGVTPLEPEVLDARSRARAQAQVAAAQSALNAAGEQARMAVAAQKQAATELERLRPLADKGLVSRDVFDRAATEAKTTAAARRSTEFGVEVARYELEAARTLLEYSAGTVVENAESVPVRSPIDGRILKVVHACEGPVRTGEPLLEVGDPTALEVEVDVLSADAVRIKPGMRVLFERWGGDKPLEGIVRVVEPVGFTKVSALGVEEQRVLVISDFTSPAAQWASLGDGYRVEARFILWHGDDVLRVPVGSLFRHDGKWAVFVAEDGVARLRVVGTGRREGLEAQVLEGLAAGDQVIDHPSDAVEDGGRIKALE